MNVAHILKFCVGLLLLLSWHKSASAASNETVRWQLKYAELLVDKLEEQEATGEGKLCLSSLKTSIAAARFHLMCTESTNTDWTLLGRHLTGLDQTLTQLPLREHRQEPSVLVTVHRGRLIYARLFKVALALVMAGEIETAQTVQKLYLPFTTATLALDATRVDQMNKSLDAVEGVVERVERTVERLEATDMPVSQFERLGSSSVTSR